AKHHASLRCEWRETATQVAATTWARWKKAETKGCQGSGGADGNVAGVIGGLLHHNSSPPTPNRLAK
ncbi:MAG: hypothetical protein ACF787_01895, partial [Rhodopirellula sp. JB053]